MRILLLANHFNTGGITSYLLTLAQGLKALGHDVVVASSGGDCVADLESCGGVHHNVPLKIKSCLHPSVVVSAFQLARLVKKNRIDVLHVHTRVTQACAGIVEVLTGVPYVSTAHGFFRPHWGRKMFNSWGKGIVAITPQVKEHLIEDLGVQSERIDVVPNGIDLGKFSPPREGEKNALRQEYGLGESLLVGMVARLSDVKGQDVLINAWGDVLKSCPEAKCVLVGVGPYASYLRDLVSQKNLQESIQFYSQTRQASTFYKMFDVAVQPSRAEGMGLAAIEAGACGIPVVASNVGGIPEVVKPDQTGLLVESENSEALAAAIVKLLKDGSYRKVLGVGARKFVSENFSAEKMVEGTLQVYKKIVSLRGAN